MNHDKFTARLSMRGSKVDTFVNGRRWRSWYNLPLIHRLAWRWVNRFPREAEGGGSWPPTTSRYTLIPNRED